MDIRIDDDFIDPAIARKKVPCPKCTTLNEIRFGVCFRCGAILPRKIYEERRDAFAEGLPAWDIEPPQVIVRRTKRK